MFHAVMSKSTSVQGCTFENRVAAQMNSVVTRARLSLFFCFFFDCIMSNPQPNKLFNKITHLMLYMTSGCGSKHTPTSLCVACVPPCVIILLRSKLGTVVNRKTIKQRCRWETMPWKELSCDCHIVARPNQRVVHRCIDGS